LATNVPGEPVGGATPAAYSGGTGAGAGTGFAGLLGAGALAAIAIALFLVSNNVSTSNCIAKAEATFPTVPVSAFVTGNRSATGPLKVSFSKERAQAVAKC
jgi:hypothetical protein